MDNSQTPDSTESDPAGAMRALRMQILTTPASELGIEKSAKNTSVYGALLEFPIDKNTATVVALSDGNASLYTTSTFGVIGGIGHDNVRAAATAFVKAANEVHDDAVATLEYPYPASDRVRFYLLTHSGVRVIDTDLASIEAGRSKYTGLYGRGQDVLTQLRLTTQQ